MRLVVSGWVCCFFQDHGEFRHVLMIHCDLIRYLLEKAEDSSEFIKGNAQLKAALNEFDKI